MKCENCRSRHAVQNFSVTVTNVGMIWMLLCFACRTQVVTVAQQQRGGLVD